MVRYAPEADIGAAPESGRLRLVRGGGLRLGGVAVRGRGDEGRHPRA